MPVVPSNLAKRSLVIALAGVVISAGVVASIIRPGGDAQIVQTAAASRDKIVSTVSASGQIVPRRSVSIGSSSMGRVAALYVSEGDPVQAGQLLASVESVQVESEVEVQRVLIQSAKAELGAARAMRKGGERDLYVAEAAVDRADAERRRSALEKDRAERLQTEGLIAEQEYERTVFEQEVAAAAVKEARARLEQVKAQLEELGSRVEAAEGQVALATTNYQRAAGLLQETNAFAPFDGVVTDLAVRVGETVVPGIQGSPGSRLMTIADMSSLSAELRAGEADVVELEEGQQAVVSIDALSGREIPGTVVEIGNSAQQRVGSSAAGGEGAKDFRLLVRLNEIPYGVKPGLSCTGTVTTAVKDEALAVPFQALTQRRRREFAAESEARDGASTDEMDEMLGVFIVEAGIARFRPVETGIADAANIEIVEGVEEGVEVIVGGYKIVRDLADGARVRVR